MALPQGTRLGRYEIHSLIGAGGMGEVYRARDPHLARDVAVKIVPRSLSDVPRLERFRREALTIAALAHPNIVTVFDVGVDDPVFLVTELLGGETLRQRLQRGPLPSSDALVVLLQILSGLEAAHNLGIVHRDLKPENVFLTETGAVKILDFGLAKTLAMDTGGDAGATVTHLPTVDGAVLGTVGYMAPEQVRGLPVDHRADIFSAGVLLYEMLSGSRPFRGISAADTVAAVLHQQAPPLAAGDPSPFEHVIHRCLTKDPPDRYQSVADLRRDLEDAGGRIDKAAQEHSIAVLPFTNLSGDPENQYFGDGLAEDLINALTQLPGVHVASRTSSFRFGGREGDVAEIGRTLRVATVLEGSVRRAGERLRVTAQLISVANGYHLWSQRYDRQVADVFDIQDDIVRAIVESLAPALSGDSRTTVRRPTDNLEAYELYLKGRHYLNQRQPSTLRTAIQCFEQVIALDPEYALAYCGLADSYAIYRVYGWFPFDATQPRAFDAVTRAVQLAPTMSEVNFSRALYTFYFEPDWRAARPYLEHALQASPRNASARGYSGVINAIDGNEDAAIADVAAAQELEPLSALIRFLVTVTFNILGKFTEAEDTARSALLLDPDSLVARWALAAALCGLHRTSEAVTVAAAAVSRSRAPFSIGVLSLAYGFDGRADDVAQLRAELIERASRGEYVSPVTELQAAIGLKDRAAIRAALHSCVIDRTAPLTLLATCGPWLAALRHERDINGLLSRLY
jgi:TolB-like protein